MNSASSQPKEQGGAVIFDYALWAKRFPEIASVVDEELASSYFEEAGLYLNNTAKSPVPSLKKRQTLLNFLVAHIALLNLSPAQGGKSLIGIITNAQQGSISLSSTQGTLSPGQAWFCQTQPGASFWAATMDLRQMRFVRAC